MEATMIKHSVTTSAPRERVWKMLTKPQNMSKWFAPLVIEFDYLVVGEKIAFTHEGKTTYGSIAAVEPTGRFAFYWGAHPDYDEIKNLVTFRLEEVDEGTRITVTEEGFEALPAEVRQAQFDGNAKGWGIVLDRIVKTLSEND
jgi:uncharacterized protein YndB with AHSA1/START domain